MRNVTNTYDSTAGGNYGKGKRTSMSDYFGSNSQTWKYDNQGRLVSESKIVDSNTYTTGYSYDGANRISTITYPTTNEVVTQTYDLRGLPYSLSGTSAGTLVNSAYYNQLGAMTEINVGGTTVLKTTFGYYGTGGSYDTTGGYYGRLWEIKSTKQPGGSPVLYDMRFTWDANGNLTNRSDQVSPYSDSGTFSYDYFNRLTLASVDYTENYAYDLLGNLLSKGGSLCTYGAKPHAVTAVGASSYVYDNNGNMSSRAETTIAWDLDNKPKQYGASIYYYYDGDGNRVKEVDGNTIVYIGKYYEKNITTSEVTTHYYLGGKQIAVRKGSTVSYLIQDQVTSTSVVADTGGNSTGTMRFYPFGDCRNSTGTIPTDKQFTGQRLDSTGLYYYGARYYDSTIGRFISPDTVVSSLANPQSLNRYSYVLNNPLKYTDPSGHVNVADFDGLPRRDDDWPVGVLHPNPPVTSGPSTLDLVLGFVIVLANPGNIIERDLESITISLPAAETEPVSPPPFANGLPNPLNPLDPWLFENIGMPVLGTAAVPNLGNLTNELALIPKPPPAVTGRGAVTIGEQMAMKVAMSDPAAGKTIIQQLGDPRWPASQGWVKKQLVANDIVVHYNYNEVTGAVADMKITYNPAVK